MNLYFFKEVGCLFTTTRIRRFVEWIEVCLISRSDKWSADMMLILIIAYVIAYAIIQTNGFVIESFSWTYLLVLMPIWLIDGIRWYIELRLPNAARTGSEDLGKVNIIIPAHNSAGVIDNTVNSLFAKGFSANQIVVSINGATDGGKTLKLVKNLGVRYLNNPEPIGKVRAINNALINVLSPYVLILDDDTCLLKETSIPTELLDKGYGAVAYSVEVADRNWLTDLQAFEYRKSNAAKQAHGSSGSVQNISGAIGLFRREVLLEQIEMHSTEFPGEDLQRTLLLHLFSNTRGVALVDSKVITEAPNSINQLWNQRVFGWWPGMYANIPNYFKLIFKKGVRRSLRLDAAYNLFAVLALDPLRALTLPILLLYPWYFFITWGTYTILEVISWVRIGRKGPLWVVLVYPLYGLFNFLTRVCAYRVYVTRRFLVKLKRGKYPDDHVHSPWWLKLIISPWSVIPVALLFATNVIYNYTEYLISWSFWLGK